MGSGFLDQFMAGWQMGQQRKQGQRQDEELRLAQESEARRAQQDEMDRRLRMEQLKIAQQRAKVEQQELEFEGKAKQAAMLSREQELLPPQSEDLGGGAVLNLGAFTQPRAPIMGRIPGTPEDSPEVPLPFKEDVAALREQEDVAAGNMFQMPDDPSVPAMFRGKVVPKNPVTEALAKRLFEAPKVERPVSVSPGGRLIDPGTGRVIFRAPERPEAGEAAVGVAPGVTGGDLLAALSPQDRANVEGIIEGRLDPRGLASLRKDRREYLMGLASRVDPTFTMADYATRVKTRAEFATGKAAQNVRSLNTVMGHLDDLAKAAEKLDNRSFVLWNRATNAGLTQFGDARVTNFNKVANAVESELATLFKGTGATDQEIKSWRETLNASQSPEQLEGGITTLLDLIRSRMDALSDQYEKGMGRQLSPDDLLSPKARTIYEKYSGEQLSAPAGAAPAAGGTSKADLLRKYGF